MHAKSSKWRLFKQDCFYQSFFKRKVHTLEGPGATQGRGLREVLVYMNSMGR